jgi:acetolactate synthase-1/2/3 large subunit
MSSSEGQGATVTVGAAMAETLARSGVKVAFTVPGEAVLGLIESLGQNKIRVIASRHEGAASFMGAAVGQLTGRPALCLATRGPGAANLAIGLHAAQADSVPLIAIVGQVRRDVRGREAFQEMDLVSVFQPLVKWAGEVKQASDAVALLERALVASMKGRPGPVLLSVPADVLDEVAPGFVAGRPAIHPEQHVEPDPTLVRKVLHLLTDARRPLILAGAGVMRARSTDALVRFAETVRVPVVAAWRRADVFPNDNPLYLGMTGNGAPETVRRRIEEADALLVLGSRLGEITSYGYQIPVEGTRWAQVDVEPHPVAGLPHPDIVMSSDVAVFLRVAQRLLSRAALMAESLDERTAANAVDRAAYEAATVVDQEEWSGPGVHPGRVVATLAQALPPEAIVTTDAGDFGTWAARGMRFRRPGTFLGSSAGPMGYGLPAAIGATLARPGRLGVALAGDGGFAMSMAEIETAVRERAHVIALVFDNGRYGTIFRQQQQRGSGAGIATKLGRVDFAAVAEACGALGLSVRTDDEFEPALRQAMDAGRPAVIHLEMDPAWTLAGILPAVVEETATEPETAAEAAPEAEPEAEPETEPEAEPETAAEAEPELEPEAEPETASETAPEPEAVVDAEPEAAPEATAEAEPAGAAAEIAQEATDESETSGGAEPQAVTRKTAG